MKTLYCTIIAIMFASCFVLSSAHAQDCMGGQFCGGKIQPSASVGDRDVTVSLKLYSHSTIPSNAHYLWLRFSDANTNQTIQHVSFFLNVTKDDESMLHDLFNTPNGVITLQVNSIGTAFNGTVLGDSEPMFGGWMPHGDEPVVVYAPAFDDATAKYRLNIVMYSIDQDNNTFTMGTAPKFDFHLNLQDQDMILSIPYSEAKSKQVSPMQHGYPPFDTAYSSNPVIITQVELATPLQPGNQSGTDCVTYSNGTEICHSYSSPYRTNIHSPYYNIQCVFFGGICQLTHQIENLGNQYNSLQQYPQGTQWIQIYNQMNSTVHLTHFGVTPILDDVLHLQDMPPQYAGADYTGYTNFTMSPHHICSYGFIAGPIGSALEFPLNDTSLAVVYDYNGVHHVAATPFLVDLNNDSKTWQYDGSQWVFTDSVVSVPEFPFVIPILLIGTVSVITFYRINFRK